MNVKLSSIKIITIIIVIFALGSIDLVLLLYKSLYYKTSGMTGRHREQNSCVKEWRWNVAWW